MKRDFCGSANLPLRLEFSCTSSEDPYSAVIDSIASANTGYILAGLSITCFIRYLESCQMKILTDHQQMSLSLSNIIEISFVSSFYSLFLPGLLSGGVIRWYRFSRPRNKPFEALASITYWGLLDTFMLVLFGTIFMTFDISSGVFSSALPYLVVILSVFLLLYLLILKNFFRVHLAEKMDNGERLVVLRTVKKTIQKMIRSIVQFQDLPRRSPLLMIGLSLLGHALGVLVFYVFALSLKLDLSVMNAGWIRSFIRIITMLPVSISGFGIREGTLIVVLRNYGIDPAYAVSFSFLLFSRMLLVGLVGGILEMKMFLYSKFRRTDGKKAEDIVQRS
jgi:uncharacterized protein (TIRG00374 family)